MKFINKLHAQSTIRRTAKHFNQSTKQTRKEMQEALDAAWATTDPETKAFQEQLFPKGKPTLEEFIITVARHTKQT